jgi:transcriptional regulator of aromatic amino acid metabolism
VAAVPRQRDQPGGGALRGTGSGKEYFAKAIHEASARRGKPFVAVNCAAIPETLIESELFGHLPGSFSGDGAKGKRGRIQEADGGTPFLDEIGDMALALQARLLRVLAEREVLPVGATRPVRVDIRVVAATHHDLEALVRERRFRDDLFYRLAGAHLQRPPLRARRDLPWLVQTMLEQQQPSQPPVRLSPDAQAGLARRKQRAEWVALRKGVAHLFRYREFSLQANARYLDALAAVDDPTPGKQALQRLTTTKKDAAGRSCAGNNAVGATRCHLVQEPDGRRALPARLHEP